MLLMVTIFKNQLCTIKLHPTYLLLYIVTYHTILENVDSIPVQK